MFTDFWGEKVVPMSALEPAVKHASIALGASYLRYHIQSLNPGQAYKADRMQLFVMKQCSQSIVCLLQLPTPTNSAARRSQREVAMATCIILIQIAFFHNEMSTAQAHLTHGRKLIDEWKRDADFDGSALGPVIAQELAYLELKNRTLSKPALYLHDDTMPLLFHAPPLETFDGTTARYTVDMFYEYFSWQISQPVPGGFCMGTAHDSSPVMGTGQMCLMYKVPLWERQLKAYMESSGDSSQLCRDTLLVLKLWRQLTRIKVAAVVAANEETNSAMVEEAFEMRYDTLTVYFRLAKDLASELLLQQSTVQRVPTFPVDLAILTPLFYCGFHCRDWDIRREILHLLRAWSERFSSRRALAKVYALQRLIDIESEGLQPGDVVPESARIHFCHVTERSGSKVSFTYYQYTVPGSPISSVESVSSQSSF